MMEKEPELIKVYIKQNNPMKIKERSDNSSTFWVTHFSLESPALKLMCMYVKKKYIFSILSFRYFHKFGKKLKK